MKAYTWYKELKKPSWAPPQLLFGPVWTVIYILIFISFGYVLYAYLTQEISFMIVAPFVVNLIFNVIYFPFILD